MTVDEMSHDEAMELVETAIEEILEKHERSILKAFSISTVMNIVQKYNLPEEYRGMVVEIVKGKISLGSADGHGGSGRLAMKG